MVSYAALSVISKVATSYRVTLQQTHYGCQRTRSQRKSHKFSIISGLIIPKPSKNNWQFNLVGVRLNFLQGFQFT
ncbi:hypothetical protein L2E82_03962 [Cichorium intybus]|uniref:Uncharacterized protein n=1 Tax=Cichorium intybus TaxID=13427 RepID=A0ACB9H4U8_CICIN|nr:hypothetical protein L2E82_03962 [Cichorium intybus]